MDKKINYERNAIIDFHLKRIAIVSVYYLGEEGADVAFVLPIEVRKK
ncbi:hypothetical protein [Candidatus Nitrosopelagicus brevis]|uniref:Uncharacterized protein n=1 Tax=Candidatus Nitrosopelagicus brevis TaxID=1410606 RepID=A0A0A7V185_9ARCH|nr:hypothetical protein [Candidatus Nitrosopelagicus brevis]AJA92812.1 hypothetical protein T478_1403 [Candidatus Nitrosopelagicus brevis]